jgi:hypothetical protein
MRQPGRVVDGDDWHPELILEHGLPAAPRPPLRDGDEVPVAVWRGADLAAVLSVGLDGAHASEEDDSRFSQYIEVLLRTSSGWESTGSAPGSDWPVPYGDRFPCELPRFTGLAAGVGQPGESQLWLRSGIAPVGVARVRAVVAGGQRVEVDAEPVSGAFLVAVPDVHASVELVSLGVTS